MKPPRMPVLSLLSIALPLAGAAYAKWFDSNSQSNTMGGAIGQLIAAYLYFAIACVAGETCAIVALVRGEQPGWLAGIGALVNLSAVIPPIILFSKGGS